MPSIGLVTVIYKSNDVLEGFFKSLSIQTLKDYCLYIVDNSPSTSTDDLINDLIIKYPIPAYKHIKNIQNVGVAKGNNQGIELALDDKSDFVLLLNNDIEFYQDNLIEKMVSYAVENNESIIIPKIFYYDTRIIWMAGGKMQKNRATSKHVGLDEDDLSKYNNNAYFDYAPTCFMLINKIVFDTIGLMDEKYFVYYDDADFIIRATQKSFKIFYMPFLEIFHKVSSSTGGGHTLFSIYYLNRNRFYFINKNLGFPNKQIAMVYSLLTRAVTCIKYNNIERRELIKAVKDGLAIKTDNNIA